LEPERRMSVLGTVAASAGPHMANRVPPRMVALSADTRRRLAWLMVIVSSPVDCLDIPIAGITSRIAWGFPRPRSACYQFTTEGYAATRRNFIIPSGRPLWPRLAGREGEFAVGARLNRPGLDGRIDVQRPVDVRVLRVRAGHVLPADLGHDAIGVDDKHQQVRFALVVPVGHRSNLRGSRGMDEPLLGEGHPARGGGVLPVLAGLLPVRRRGDVVDDAH